MVLYLCSDKVGFITGENICIDKGMTRQMSLSMALCIGLELPWGILDGIGGLFGVDWGGLPGFLRILPFFCF